MSNISVTFTAASNIDRWEEMKPAIIRAWMRQARNLKHMVLILRVYYNIISTYFILSITVNMELCLNQTLRKRSAGPVSKDGGCALTSRARLQHIKGLGRNSQDDVKGQTPQPTMTIAMLCYTSNHRMRPSLRPMYFASLNLFSTRSMSFSAIQSKSSLISNPKQEN